MLAVAATVWASDLFVKLVLKTPLDYYHQRSAATGILIVIVAAALGHSAPQAGSLAVAICAGMMIGASVGNAVSILIFPQGVPDPLLLNFDGYTLAFNLADTCLLASTLIALLLLPSQISEAFANRRESTATTSGWNGDERRALGLTR